MVDLEIFAGRITSTGFSSGDRIVIGDWKDSPIGSFSNIMLSIIHISEHKRRYANTYEVIC